MKLKLIAVLASSDKTELIIQTAREAGATGATVISSGRGEGLRPAKTFLGLDLAASCDLLLFIVVENRAREILERIHDAAQFEQESGAGIAFQLNIEDAVGLSTQMDAILAEIEDAI